MSHRHDRVRVYNLGVSQYHYATGADGRSGVLHVLAYPTPYPRQPVDRVVPQAVVERPRLANRGEGRVARGRQGVGRRRRVPPAGRAGLLRARGLGLSRAEDEGVTRDQSTAVPGGLGGGRPRRGGVPASRSRSEGGDRRRRKVRHVRPRARRDARPDVRPARRPRPARRRAHGRDQGEPDRPGVDAARHAARRPRALGPPQGGRRGGAPRRPRRRAARAPARERLCDRHAPRRVHVPGRLGRAGDHGSGPPRRAREHERGARRERVPPLRRARRRPPLPLLPPPPGVPRLRRVRVAGQAQGPHDDRRDAQHEELLRQRADDGVRRLLAEGPARRAAAQRPQLRVPRRLAPAVAARRTRARPRFAAPRGLPHPAGGRRRLRRAADRHRDRRRDRHDGRDRGAVERRRGLPRGRARGRHQLREHRRGLHRGDGIRPDGPCGRRPRSARPTT